MKKIISATTVLVLFSYTISGQISTASETFINMAQNLEKESGFIIEGPSLLHTCIGNYYINDLPSDISNAHWVITDNSKLQIIEENGINGCRVERVSFKSNNIGAFYPREVYPHGKTELVFNFEWNGYFYSVSKTITFGVEPRIDGIFELETNQGIRGSEAGYTLNQMTSYYFVGNIEGQDNSRNAASGYEYRWVVNPQGMPIFPSEHFGKSTRQFPISFSEVGNYTLSLSIADGCGFGEKLHQPFVVAESNLYSIAPNPVSNELLFTSLVNPAQCRSGRGTVVFHDIRSGAVVFQQSHDFCTTFSISTHTIPNGLYLVRLVMNGHLIQQENIWVRHL